MQEEVVDIVDEKDNVIGSASKSDAHQKGLLHRTVISEIMDSQGRFALVLQSSDRQDAGRYVSPIGGHVRSGESEDEALKRESLEETGLQNFNFHLIGKAIFNRTVLGRQEHHYFILYEIASDNALVLNSESVAYKHFTKEELTNTIIHSPNIFGDAFYFVLEKFYPQILPDHYIYKF